MKIVLQFNSQSKSKNILKAIKIAKKLNGELDGKYYKLFFKSINDENLLVLSSLVEFLSGSHIFIDGEDCGRPYHLERRINSIVDCYYESICNEKCLHDDKFELKIASEFCNKLKELNKIKDTITKFSPEGTPIEGTKMLVQYKSKTYTVKIIDGLKTLNLQNKSIIDIKQIKGLEKLIDLEFLDLSFNRIPEIKGLEPLVNLKGLDLNSNIINEIKGLETLRNLNFLYLDDNSIKEIKGLENLINLQDLTIDEDHFNKKLLIQIKKEKILEVKCPFCNKLCDNLWSHFQICKFAPSNDFEIIIRDLIHSELLRVGPKVKMFSLLSLFFRFKYDFITEKSILIVPLKRSSKINKNKTLFQEFCPFCNNQFKDLSSHITKCKFIPKDDIELLNTLVFSSLINNYGQKFVQYCRRKKTEIEKMEKKITVKLKQILANSSSIKLDEIKDTLEIDAHTFNNKILDWALKFGFTIDGNYLITKEDTISDFIDELDRQYAIWNKRESEKYKEN